MNLECSLRNPNITFVSRLSSFLATCVLLIWCAPADAQFTLDREPPGPSSRKTGLVITEIMYNPRAVPGVANTNLTHEFIELFNSKPWDEDLSGFAIAGVVHYAFAPGTILAAGGYLVVARVPGMIQTNYGITNVVGPWDGATTNRLSPDAGLIRLLNRQGAVLLEINYRDSPPWPETADGAGHSISLVRPSLGEDNVNAWAESDSVGGSPGGPDPMTLDPLASVFINEWMNHSDPEDWIELYNHSNGAVDLSGAYLSDNPLTNKFRIPNGTTIPARGHLVYYQTQLGFELFAGGESIFFWNSNATRCIDVIDFRGSSNNVTSGRSPDGGPITFGLAVNSPGGPNSVRRKYPVVINEIMYSPISGNSDDEYVEIYNRSSTAVNLAGWEFVVGLTYVFPTNSFTANMPPGAHWVVARNPTNLFAIYSNLNSNNTFGPYTGTLANGGERLALASADYDNIVVNGVPSVAKLNVVVSDVTYGDGGKWGNWSDGLGSSLELIDADADIRYPSNWADSNDTGESLWTALEYNGPLGESLGSPANDRIILMSQGTGEFLIDEVEVRVDQGPNLVDNGGFESGLSGWTLQGSHDFSTIENEGFIGSKSLHVRAGSRGDNQANRILSAPFTSVIPPGPHNVSIRAKVRWFRGQPEVLVRLHGSATEAFGRLSLPRKLGTPGTTNSTRIVNAGPAVFEVKHAPVLPATNEPVVITARASDPQGIAAMTLRYRLDPNPAYTDLTMVDNGTDGDAIANDGIYSATIPGQPGGQMVAFYVEARDGLNALGTFPAQVFPLPGFDRCWPNDAVAREALVRWGEVQMPGDFATYHLWVSAVNSNRWHIRAPLNNTPMDGTFVYNNTRVIYDALPLFSGSPWHRTNSTTGPAGPNRVDYVMSFPGDDALLGSTDFVLNNPGNPDINTVSDQSAVAEQTVYKIFEGLGLPNNHRRNIHFFVNGSQRSTVYERPGNFIFEDSQQPNGDMIAEWFPNDAGGNLYKVEDWFEFENNGFDISAYNDADMERRMTTINGVPTFVPGPYRYMFRKRSVNVGNSANDYSQIFSLIEAASPSDNPTNAVIDPDLFSTIADWEQWMRHFAAHRTVGNFDSFGWDRGKNDYLYKSATNGFVHMPWDIDYSLGLGRPPTEPLFASNDPRVRAMFNTPAIVRAYWRAFEEIVNGPFRNAYLDPFIDARVNALLANNINIDLDAVARIKNYITDRRAYLVSQLATVAVPLAVDGATSFSTPTNLYTLTGTAPVGVKTITLNGVSYPMTWLSATSFVMRVVLQPGFNTLTLQGYDRYGVALVGATTAVSAEYTGPVPDPFSALVITEIMYAPSVNGAQFVEIVNRSELNFDLSGWRLDGVGLTFPLGSIVTNGQTLLLAQNRAIFASTYGNRPVFAVFNTALTGAQTLALIRTNGTWRGDVVDAVRYEAGPPWVVAAAGQSLQLIDAAQDNSRPGNWAVSALVPATPGTTNSVATTLPPYDALWLNEVQFLSFFGPLDNAGDAEPWLELYNAGATPIALDNYFLADNVTTNLTSWAFPPGITLAPGEYKMIWADGEPLEATATDLHTSFRLVESGKLALVHVTNSVTEIVDYLAWNRLGANLSYGSFPEGQPVFRFNLEHPTPGTTNVARPVPVSINEYLASNGTGLADPADGDRDDWIELFNGSGQSVDLGGFYLTDTTTNLMKYLIPKNGQYRIPAGGYLLVWADDEASQNSPARADLHVNFKLPTAGGYIGLFTPDGLTPVDTLTFGPQTANVSEGRYADGSYQRYSMNRPTPRGPNAIPGYNSAPRFPVVTNQFVSPGQNITVNFRATDPDANPIIYGTNNTYTGVSLSGGGNILWRVPTNQPLGNYPFTVTATDNGVPPLGDTLSFVITVRSVAGATNAANPVGPLLRSVVRFDGQATFTIETTAGRTYRVLYKDDLNDPVWLQLGPDFVAANATASLTDGVLMPRRFYKVVQVN